jgi:sulfur relay (sulfurtransferase) complex TusBCD TusD component (DsrE family)
VKVAYIINSPHAAWYKVGKMILPQLEEERHGVEVVGMFFFDDNAWMLRKGDPVGERLGKIAQEKGMLLMICDQCASSRSLAKKVGENAYEPSNTIEGVQVGCFPDLYSALSGNMPDQVITL